MAMTMSLVAAFLRTGAAPTVRLMPAKTAFTLSSEVGLASLAARWKCRMAARRRPSVDGRLPSAACAARKAPTTSADAGKGLRPRPRHHSTKIAMSLL
jgi:hypothetical protein